MTLNKEKVATPIELIFIPEYIVNALKSRNVSLADLDSSFKIELHKFVSDGYKLDIGTNNARQILDAKLSKLDIQDLAVYNNFRVLGFDINHTESFIESIVGSGDCSANDELRNKTVLGLYDNTLSRNIADYIYVSPGTDCLFVILRTGFSNYIVNKDNDSKIALLSNLVNSIVKYFGEDRLLASKVFNRYLKLVS